MVSTDVTINVWDSETNADLSGAVVILNGTNYSTPLEIIFGEGTVLHMLASKSGYTDENRTVSVKDASTVSAPAQQITFLLSANLVRHS